MYEEIMTNNDNLEFNLVTSSLLKTSGLHAGTIYAAGRLVAVLGEPLRAKYYGGLEKTSISHDRKYCTVIG